MGIGNQILVTHLIKIPKKVIITWTLFNLLHLFLTLTLELTPFPGHSLENTLGDFLKRISLVPYLDAFSILIQSVLCSDTNFLKPASRKEITLIDLSIMRYGVSSFLCQILLVVTIDNFRMSTA